MLDRLDIREGLQTGVTQELRPCNGLGGCLEIDTLHGGLRGSQLSLRGAEVLYLGLCLIEDAA